MNVRVRARPFDLLARMQLWYLHPLCESSRTGGRTMKSARTIRQPGRRKFIRDTSAVAVASLGAPYIWAQGKTDDTLVVNSFGGEYQELVEKAVIQPFEKKFGVKVVHDTTGTSAQDYAKIRASKGAPGFDVAAALSPPEVVLGAKENLLEKITEKEVPNIKYTWEKARATQIGR